jgi:hypothetical protein
MSAGNRKKKRKHRKQPLNDNALLTPEMLSGFADQIHALSLEGLRRLVPFVGNIDGPRFREEQEEHE